MHAICNITRLLNSLTSLVHKTSNCSIFYSVLGCIPRLTPVLLHETINYNTLEINGGIHAQRAITSITFKLIKH